MTGRRTPPRLPTQFIGSWQGSAAEFAWVLVKLAKKPPGGLSLNVAGGEHDWCPTGWPSTAGTRSVENTPGPGRDAASSYSVLPVPSTDKA